MLGSKYSVAFKFIPNVDVGTSNRAFQNDAHEVDISVPAIVGFQKLEDSVVSILYWVLAKIINYCVMKYNKLI